MKKLISGACALVAIAMTMASCGKCNGDASSCKAANDSLTNVYGQYVGTVLAQDFSTNTQNPIDKTEFLRGLQLVFGSNGDRSTQIGLQIGLQMLGEMSQLEEQGIYIDRAKALAAFKQAFLADSISPEQGQMIRQEMMRMMSEAREKAAAEKAAEKAQSPEAQENVKKGEEYVAKLKADGENIATTASGLSYKIEDAGQGDKPKENSTVVVNYTGKHLNGTVFDSTDGRTPATFNLQGVVPGFREGIMLLGKTGRATLYIPGELAYGPEGQPAAGIGPNEMLVFDVEVLEIDPE